MQMDTKKKVIILVTVCLVVLIGAIIGDKLLSKTYFKKIEYTEIINKIENDESFIFVISQTTCNHCASFKPKITKLARKYKLHIYYIDVDLLSKEEDEEFKKYVKYDGTPATIFIKNGEESSVATRINGDASMEKIENKLKSNGFIE